MRLPLLLTVLSLAPAAGADVLLDNGSLGAAGRTVNAQWRIYQPFTVTGAGWHIETIAVDGFRDIDPADLGMRGVLLKDNGSGQPNEIDEAALFDIRLMPHATADWVEAAVDLELLPGNYWIRWTANDGAYYGAVWRGTAGQASWSVNNFTGQVFASDPTALRIEGTPLPPTTCADADGDGDVDFDDLNLVLEHWGDAGPDGDVDDSGHVDFDDLNLVLAAWQTTCL